MKNNYEGLISFRWFLLFTNFTNICHIIQITQNALKLIFTCQKTDSNVIILKYSLYIGTCNTFWIFVLESSFFRHFLTNFWPIFDQFLTNFDKCLTNFDQFLINFWSIFENFKRESEPSYNTRLIATDGAGQHVETEVVINVQDVNDNAPVFEKSNPTVQYSDSSPPGSLVAR